MPMPSQARNLNPTPEAVAAMFLYGESYSKSGAGSMDFWDQLAPARQTVCRDLVAKVVYAHSQHHR